MSDGDTFSQLQAISLKEKCFKEAKVMPNKKSFVKSTPQFASALPKEEIEQDEEDTIEWTQKPSPTSDDLKTRTRALKRAYGTAVANALKEDDAGDEINTVRKRLYAPPPHEEEEVEKEISLEPTLRRVNAQESLALSSDSDETTVVDGTGGDADEDAVCVNAKRCLVVRKAKNSQQCACSAISSCESCRNYATQYNSPTY